VIEIEDVMDGKCKQERIGELRDANKSLKHLRRSWCSVYDRMDWIECIWLWISISTRHIDMIMKLPFT
jgi:hypothetical protein